MSLVTPPNSNGWTIPLMYSKMLPIFIWYVHVVFAAGVFVVVPFWLHSCIYWRLCWCPCYITVTLMSLILLTSVLMLKLPAVRILAVASPLLLPLLSIAGVISTIAGVPSDAIVSAATINLAFVYVLVLKYLLC
jgi:hypothetical protein